MKGAKIMIWEMLYNKYIVNKSDKYIQWWNNSELSISDITNEIMEYVYQNSKDLRFISINGNYTFQTLYFRRSRIELVLLDKIDKMGFKFVKLYFKNWSIVFYKRGCYNVL